MYQIADLNNGPFGDTYSSLEAAEAALAVEIEKGQKINEEHSPAQQAAEFFCIVNTKTGEEIWP